MEGFIVVGIFVAILLGVMVMAGNSNEKAAKKQQVKRKAETDDTWKKIDQAGSTLKRSITSRGYSTANSWVNTSSLYSYRYDEELVKYLEPLMTSRTLLDILYSEHQIHTHNIHSPQSQFQNLIHFPKVEISDIWGGKDGHAIAEVFDHSEGLGERKELQVLQILGFKEVKPQTQDASIPNPDNRDIANIASEEHHQILGFRKSGLMGELYEWLITLRGLEKPMAFSKALEIAELIDSLNAKKIISISNLHNISYKTLIQIQKEHSSKEDNQMNMFIAFMKYRSVNPIVITDRQQNEQGKSIPETSSEPANHLADEAIIDADNANEISEGKLKISAIPTEPMEPRKIRELIIEGFVKKRSINITHATEEGLFSRDVNVVNLHGEKQLYHLRGNDHSYGVLDYGPNITLGTFEYYEPALDSLNKIKASEVVSGFFTGGDDSFKVPETYDQLTPQERGETPDDYLFWNPLSSSEMETNYRFSFHDFVHHLQTEGVTVSHGSMFSNYGKPNNIAGFVAKRLLGIDSDQYGIGRKTKAMTENQVFKEAFGFDSKTTTLIMRANNLELNPDFFSNIEKVFAEHPSIRSAEFALGHLADEWGNSFPKIQDEEIELEFLEQEQQVDKIKNLKSNPAVLLKTNLVLEDSIRDHIMESLSQSDTWSNYKDSFDSVVHAVVWELDEWLDNLKDLLNEAVSTFDSNFESELQAKDVSDPFDEGEIWSRQWQAISSYGLWEYWSEEVLEYEHPLSNPSNDIVQKFLERDQVHDVYETFSESFETLCQGFIQHAYEQVSINLDVIDYEELEEYEEYSEYTGITEAYSSALQITDEELEYPIRNFVNSEFYSAMEKHEEDLLLASNEICLFLKQVIEP